jgi:hypothetical protein
MEAGFKHQPMVLSTKVSIIKAKRMERGYFNGLMEAGSKENFPTIYVRVMGFKFGLISGDIKVNGAKTECMVLGLSRGKMVGNIRENISMVKKTDLELLRGPIEQHIKEFGPMANNMGADSTFPTLENEKLEYKFKENELNNLMNNTQIKMFIELHIHFPFFFFC